MKIRVDHDFLKKAMISTINANSTSFSSADIYFVDYIGSSCLNRCNLVSICLFKVNKAKTKIMCKICKRLAIKKPK